MHTNTDRLYQKRLRAFRRMVDVPEWGKDDCITAICRGEDSIELAEEIANLHFALDDRSRPYLAQWAANYAGPIVASGGSWCGKSGLRRHRADRPVHHPAGPDHDGPLDQ